MGSVIKRIRKARANYEADRAGYAPSKTGRALHRAGKRVDGMVAGLRMLTTVPPTPEAVLDKSETSP